MRHYDFQRIYDEFCSYYRNTAKGENEYYGWLHALKLDEQNCYGAARESFKWAKGMLNFLKEDTNNKYYGIIVGLPITSMNRNVYKERDLIAGALSLKGKHPSLNHKKSFWFNPQSKWGTLTVVDAKYEDGAVEAILQVPKSAVCPICNGAKMTSLIDEQHIVNVSLEGTITGGFEFGDPPFTLLTSDILPGIPLARIKPLEAIVAEALQSSNHRGKEKIIMKIKPRIIEDSNPTVNRPLTDTAPTVNTNTLNTPLRGEWGTPITSDTGLHSRTDSSGNAITRTGSTDASIVMKSGDPRQHVTTAVPRTAEEAPPPTKWTNPSDSEVTDDTTQPKPEDIQTGPPKKKPGDFEYPVSGQPEGAPSTIPADETPEVIGDDKPEAPIAVQTGAIKTEQDETCELGYHKDAEGNCVPDTEEQDDPCEPGYHKDETGTCVPDTAEQDEPCADGYHKNEEGNCVPDEPLAERVKRIKAETRQSIAEGQTTKIRKDMRNLETIWENKYSKLDKQFMKEQSYNRSQTRINKQLRANVRKEQLRTEDIRVELRDLKNRHSDAITVSNKTGRLVDDLKIENADIKKRYYSSLEKNLTLSKKLTATNEEYLELARAKEQVEDKLKKARVLAKKTLKLRV